jgi:hypothetical protein
MKATDIKRNLYQELKKAFVCSIKQNHYVQKKDGICSMQCVYVQIK